MQDHVSRDDGPKDDRSRAKWRQGQPQGKGQDERGEELEDGIEEAS
jgi:hypothetical protein